MCQAQLWSEMRKVASTASMLEEPTRENEELFWLQASIFRSIFWRLSKGLSIQDFSLSEAVPDSLRLHQTHWGCLCKMRLPQKDLECFFKSFGDPPSTLAPQGSFFRFFYAGICKVLLKVFKVCNLLKSFVKFCKVFQKICKVM